MNLDQFFILEQARWPVLLVEGTGRISKLNSAAAHLFGASTGGGSALLSAIWSKENPNSAEQFLASSHNGEAIILKFRINSQTERAYSTAVTYGSREGERCFIFQLMREVTVTAQPSVEAGLAHKQKLDCALQLTRSVALDFNNALTTILGHTSLLLSRIAADHPWRPSLVEIEKSAGKAAETANDLASFSRQEKDAKVQTASNVNTILQRTADLFRSPEYQGITFVFDLQRKLYTVNLDEAKMQQAFIKIIENSIQAIQGAGSSGSVTISSKNVNLSAPTQDRTFKIAAGTYVMVEIADNGGGIAPDILPRIFEPFFTTKGTTHRGLGLAWVYGIITNHGGGVSVSSEVGLGTSVRIYLPGDKTVLRGDSVNTSDLSGKETILMVDDEDLLLTMGQMVLSSYGYDVLTANSGQKALEILSTNRKPIDLVITDLVMPNMSGRELIEHIRALSPHSRVITSSGIVRSSDSGEDDSYLQKPFTSQDLLRKVKAVLSAEEQ